MRSASLVVLFVTFLMPVEATMSSSQVPDNPAPHAPSAPGVVHIPASKVDAVFATGGTLLETAHYQVHAARRADPGPAEVHAHNTDIFYVVEGAATLVTGGTLVGASEESPGETRGTAIEGGQAHPLAKGDVIVIPSGTPHQLRTVSSALRYIVVKVTRAER